MLKKVSDELTRRLTESMLIYRAKATLDKGLELLEMWQKLNKTADCSKLSCRVMAEYETDQLKSDSNDENKLEKAKRNVERNATKNKRAMTEATSRSSSTRTSSPQQGNIRLCLGPCP